MKRIFRNTLMAVAAISTLAMASCSKDNDGGQGVVEEGKDTYMSVSIAFPKGEGFTRATGDDNAYSGEADVKYIDIFIFNDGGTLTHSHRLNPADFTEETPQTGYDVYTAKNKLKTTTGQKTVYAGINLPTAMVNKIKSQSEGALENVATDVSRASIATLTNGLAMFSTEGETETFVESPSGVQNKVTLEVERLVAKVTVEKTATMTQDGAPGKLGALEFDVNKFNLKTFLVQGTAPLYKDPNWATYTATDFDEFTERGSSFGNFQTVVTKVNDTDLNTLVPRYASENTSENKTKKELTRVTVRSTFIPATMTTYVGTTLSTTDNSAETTVKTFYAVTNAAGDATYYFYDKTQAENFATSESLSATDDVLEYVNGKCYWNIFLNKATTNKGAQWDVVRNEFFRCQISRVVAPGRETPDIDDPDVRPDTDALIDATIHVLNWNTPVLGDYELIP